MATVYFVVHLQHMGTLLGASDQQRMITTCLPCCTLRATIKINLIWPHLFQFLKTCKIFNLNLILLFSTLNFIWHHVHNERSLFSEMARLVRIPVTKSFGNLRTASITWRTTAGSRPPIGSPSTRKKVRPWNEWNQTVVLAFISFDEHQLHFLSPVNWPD